MKVGVFLESPSRPHYRMCLEQFALGLRRCSVGYFTSDNFKFVPCDVAVFFGSWKHRSTPRHKLKQQIVSSGMPFIVLETPLLGREIIENPMYLRAGVGHFVNTLGEFNNKNRPDDRWEQIQKDLRIDVKPWRKNGSHILVALQLPEDVSLQGVDISKWARDTVFNIRQYTNRPVVIRAHPVGRQYNMKLINEALQLSNVSFTTPGAVPLELHLQNAWASVTCTSGMAIDSVMAGIPAYGTHVGSFVYDLEHDLATIDNPKTYDRTQWLNDMGYTQWTFHEMAAGMPWMHLRDLL